jgi:hypothetical protein
MSLVTIVSFQLELIPPIVLLVILVALTISQLTREHMPMAGKTIENSLVLPISQPHRTSIVSSVIAFYD